jgi:hypothetical protein
VAARLASRGMRRSAERGLKPRAGADSASGREQECAAAQRESLDRRHGQTDCQRFFRSPERHGEAFLLPILSFCDRRFRHRHTLSGDGQRCPTPAGERLATQSPPLDGRSGGSICRLAGDRCNSRQVFTSSIGVLYLGLGVYGWFAPGLFLDSPLAIPLGVGDNVFHLLLSAPALSIVAFDLLASRRPSGLSARG